MTTEREYGKTLRAASKAILLLKKTHPHIFPQFIELNKLRIDLRNLQHEVDCAQERWDNYGKNPHNL